MQLIFLMNEATLMESEQQGGGWVGWSVCEAQD